MKRKSEKLSTSNSDKTEPEKREWNRVEEKQSVLIPRADTVNIIINRDNSTNITNISKHGNIIRGKEKNNVNKNVGNTSVDLTTEKGETETNSLGSTARNKSPGLIPTVCESYFHTIYFLFLYSHQCVCWIFIYSK